MPVRFRRKVQLSVRSADGGSRLRRVSRRSDPARGVTLSEVESTTSLLMWKTELARATALRECAEKKERFAREQYAEALKRVAAPVAATGDRPSFKRARTTLGVPGKGKGKAREVVVEEVEDDDDELTGSKVDKVVP